VIIGKTASSAGDAVKLKGLSKFDRIKIEGMKRAHAWFLLLRESLDIG
jgi:hypothetical protein